MMNFVLKTRNLVSKTRNLVLKLMNVADYADVDLERENPRAAGLPWHRCQDQGAVACQLCEREAPTWSPYFPCTFQTPRCRYRSFLVFFGILFWYFLAAATWHGMTPTPRQEWHSEAIPDLVIVSVGIKSIFKCIKSMHCTALPSTPTPIQIRSGCR